MKYLTQYVPQGSGEGMSDGYVVVEEDGVLKAQRLSLDGTTATPDGTTEAIGNVGLFATGMDEPAYNGSGTGGAAKFYKCASVDTDNKTWAGYEMMLQDNKYVQSTVLTNGLFFTTVEPVVGTVYTADALITAFPYTGIFGTVDNIAYTSYSCPINPDDYVFGDYVISASTELPQDQTDNRTAYNAFVENESHFVGHAGITFLRMRCIHIATVVIKLFYKAKFLDIS